MKKLFIIFLCIFLSGCTTFSKTKLNQHNHQIYLQGFYDGYLSHVLKLLEN